MYWARSILLLIAALVAAPTLAHAPVRDEGHYALTREDPFVIVEPEISKAYYMELTGEPHVYRIDSLKAFDFYAGLLQPKLEECPMTRTFSLELLDESFRRMDWADGSTDRWTAFYERFARDWYWKGPELGLSNRSTRSLPQGTYYLRVFNADNRGKYVLAVGDTEWFHFHDLIHLPEMIRWMNQEFWDPADCEAR
jgi:hypothetical protein